MSEAPFLAEVRLALGCRADIMMFRINTGKFLPLDWLPGKPKRVIESAPPGTPDLLGVLAPGRAFAIETKSLKGPHRERQKDFQKAWERRGGIYILARTMDDVYSGLGIAP